jgi:hypothetical protein
MSSETGFRVLWADAEFGKGRQGKCYQLLPEVKFHKMSSSVISTRETNCSDR